MDPKDARTVFVRGLPFDLSDAKLEEIFSEVGPVRRAFTVKKDKGSEKHQGIAFVQFAVAEDAQQAIASKTGTSVEGRKILVELANRRPSLSERLKKKKGATKSDEQQAPSEDAPKPKNVKSEPAQPGKPGKRKQEAAAGRDKKPKKKKKQNIDPGAASKAWEKQKPARTVVLGGLKSKEILKTVVHLAKRLGTVESVQDVPVAELEMHDLSRDGCEPNAVAVVFNSVPAARNAVEAFHCQRMGDGDVWARQLGGQGSKWRNWRLIIRNLPFEITEDLLRETFSVAGFVWEVKIPRKPDGESRGFGFISYTSKRHAEEAIKTLNKTVILERPVAVDWSLSRRKYETLAKKADDEGDETASESESEEEVPQGEHQEASDDQKDDDAAESEDAGGEGEDKESPTEVDVVNRVLNRFLDASTHNQDVKGEKNKTEKELDNDKKQTGVKQEPKAEEDDAMERTLFLRNLPLDLKVPDLKQRFSAFGVVKALRPVLHPVTKKPKGTAFLEFETREAAETAVQAAKLAEDGTSSFIISGRAVLVHFAVGRDSARDIAKKTSKEEEDRDRRNLHLVTEGLIKKGTPAAEGVSEADLAKRKALQLENATKLRSPIFHVSQTRLAFHNFPKSTTEKEVKKLFLDAVKARATKQHPAIKQVKILKDEKEVPRGAGFVEFTEHQHALVALRVLNNNPGTFGPQKRPIVEFAIDNMQKLKARESRLQISKQSKAGPRTPKSKKQDKSGKEPNPKTKSKRKRKEHPDEDKPDTGKAVDQPGPKRRRMNKNRNEAKQQQPQQQQQQEQQQKQPKAKKPEKNSKPRKLAVGDKNGDESRQKRRGPKKEKEIEDRLDKLVSEYRGKYFSGGVSKTSASAPASGPMKTLENIKRWFE